MELPDALKAMLDGPTFATLATLMPDGSPQASTMWVDREGDRIRFNTAEGRVKPRNMDRDPRVAISIFATDDPYQAFSIRGRVVEKRLEGADEHIDALANKYLGVDEYPYRVPGQIRVTYLIEIDRLAAH
ncbi:MAG: PPOX class F420-dependent oxidoreductase [Acidimicrobiia bacterium]|nr:PPOX class F420-dependent oxidoreductase [Acidimicrobiia bacterium]MBT8193650.1 PPOX class F420-dependent oxidoreductase [Acidimicrobiia bacterium]NNF89472.1 PPOX class F420-dependent oxidoreductase [Acidimicrobiia bacterium]NNJ47710.1 PPOX class F420-dependent oxidoreductase [Acidimicrobiia bacterium]NNL98628.1 PPOX class F420-dependent oxidoreductase [Acidimicrobiia bacterium]